MVFYEGENKGNTTIQEKGVAQNFAQIEMQLECFWICLCLRQNDEFEELGDGRYVVMIDLGGGRGMSDKNLA